ncbi:hypothetical protein KIF59_23085 [Enterobacter cloacae subsp. cloacae]|nr:hypothetical protein [Enterobacter cloacae subsp. cloacae]
MATGSVTGSLSQGALTDDTVRKSAARRRQQHRDHHGRRQRAGHHHRGRGRHLELHAERGPGPPGTHLHPPRRRTRWVTSRAAAAGP